MAAAMAGSAAWRRTAWRATKGIAAAGGLAGVAAYFYDEGFRRAVQFNFHVLPIALHYKAVQLRSERESPERSAAAFARLHAHYAPIVLDIVLRQKGFYVKTAQFLSQYSDIIPQEYVDAFKVLRDDAPYCPFSQVKGIVEQEFGLKLQEVFLHFDTKPLGAASIGQVHAARLVGGTDVVVKVQYPGAERLFYIDVGLSIRMASVLAPHYVDVLRHLRKTFATEFDYRKEAQVQREAYTNLRHLEGVVVPEPFDEQHPYCRSLGCGLATKSVFVMERLYGRPVDKWAEEQLQEIAQREGLSADEFKLKLSQMSADALAQLVPSEQFLRVWRHWLAGRDAIRNIVAFLYNWTLGWVGSPIHYAFSPRPVDIHSIADRLFQVQAQCILEDGFINGDPHAGNVLLLDDGRLGLIDWGQVGRLSPEQRLVFARGLIAVADRDEPAIARLAWEMGVKTEKHMDWAAMKLGLFWLGSFSDEICGELGGATCFEDNLARIDRLVSAPEEYFLAVRCLMMTRGVAALIGFPVADSSRRTRPAAEACLRRAGIRFETVPGRKLPRPDVESYVRCPAKPSAA